MYDWLTFYFKSFIQAKVWWLGFLTVAIYVATICSWLFNLLCVATTVMAVRSLEKFMQSVREGQGFYRVIKQVRHTTI